MQSYLTIKTKSCAEYTEKRSRFIATVLHCESLEQANSIIDEHRAKYWDARHNVFAYSLRDNLMSRFSDDGEPHGTAGKPVFDVINGNNLKDVIVIVTRYFGGVLLGTGGLTRAYSKAASDAVKTAEIVEMRPALKFECVYNYSDNELMLAIISAFNGIVVDSEYTDRIKTCFNIPFENTENFNKKLCEAFSARVNAVQCGECYAEIKIK